MSALSAHVRLRLGQQLRLWRVVCILGVTAPLWWGVSLLRAAHRAHEQGEDVEHQVGHAFVLWALGSLAGVTSPVWMAGLAVWIEWRNHIERRVAAFIRAQRLALAQHAEASPDQPAGEFPMTTTTTPGGQ